MGDALRLNGPVRMQEGARIAQYCALGVAACAVVAASLVAAPGIAGIFGAGLGLLMLGVAVVDARRFLIPNELTLAALALALINAGIRNGWNGAIVALWRGAVLALIFFAIRAAYRWLRGREGIGLGDVKLAGVAGAWLGWTMLPIAIEIAALAALAAYTAQWLVGGRIVQRTTRVPFGLFLAPAIWLCWLFAAGFALAG
jgi:leader peptidase (prepilin peptidase) / N-methyltransferase